MALERFKEAFSAAKREEEELLGHLNDASRYYRGALELLPPDAPHDLSVVHNGLGATYAFVGDLERALSHYRQAIRYCETQGDFYNAAQARFNVALGLVRAGRFADAREYAYAALRNYETYGDRAAEGIQKTRELIAQIERDLQTQGG